MVSFRTVKRFETGVMGAITVGALCFTALNLAANPVPFLIVTGGVAAMRFSVALLKKKFNKDGKLDQFFSALSLFSLVLSEHLLFMYGGPLFATLNFTSPIANFGLSALISTILPNAVIDLSGALNDVLLPDKKEDTKSLKDEYVNLTTFEMYTSILFSTIRGLFMPKMLKHLPKIPEEINYLVLRFCSNTIKEITKNLYHLEKFSFSTCLVDAVISLSAIQTGLKAQSLAIDKFLVNGVKDIAFVLTHTSVYTLLVTGKKLYEQKDSTPKH